jgi:Zn-dependent protease
MGDPTAKSLGRLTLNPVKHIDPLGFGVFVFTALFSPFVIGWAKPVPVQPMFFRRPRQGMMLVSLAGPMTNFLVAVFCALILKFTMNLADSGVGSDSLPLWLVQQSALFGIGINCALAWFNLMPIPPLDGSHILAGLLPPGAARAYSSLGRYGMLILILLLATGMFAKVIVPLIIHSRDLIFALVGLRGL